MATSFEEIYCLNSVIKIDQRLNGKPSYELYNLYWKYLQFSISMFEYDCRKDLLDLVPFSLTKYSFTGNGVDNIFQLSPAPELNSNSSFYIETEIVCGQPKRVINNYIFDDINNTITLADYTPIIGEKIEMFVYNIGQFNEDLDYDEKRILAEGMNLPYYQEQMANSKILNFATYGGSVKMHSQAEQEKTVAASYQIAKRELEGDISRYSYRTAPYGVPGLGVRTVCLHRHKSRTKHHV